MGSKEIRVADSIIFFLRRFLSFRLGESGGHLNLMFLKKKKQPFDFSFLEEGKIRRPHNSLYYNDL
jgi:hypothetical protein